MKIYIDFDDVICETARHFTIIAKNLFGIETPYEDIHFFNLQKSFGLDDKQYEELMKAGHLTDTLLAYKETEMASETINKWIDMGHEVSVITGRPFDAYEASRKWLDDHNLKRPPLFCVDKYGRENFKDACTYSMTLEMLYCMDFDFAVEDSPSAFEHVSHFANCKIAVFDRPWNRETKFPDSRFVRCSGWTEIAKKFEDYSRTIK